MTKTKYDWKKTSKKFLWVAVEIIAAGALVYFTDNTAYLALVPVAEAFRNWLKHRNK